MTVSVKLYFIMNEYYPDLSLRLWLPETRNRTLHLSSSVLCCSLFYYTDVWLESWTKTPQLWCDKSNGGSVRTVRGWRWSLCIGTTCQSSWAIASVRHSLLAESVPPKRKFVIVRCHDKVWLSLWYEDQRVWVCGAFGSLLCLPRLSH